MQRERTIRAPASTFIVRVWTDESDNFRLRGEIEHIRTGERRAFLSYGAMLNIIEDWHRSREKAG